MEKANIKEAINGNDNEKYITPYTLKKVVDESAGSSGTPTTVTVKVNSISQLPEGSMPTVTNSGDDVNVKLNFGIPVGNTGATGNNGTNGTNGVDGQDGVDGQAATIAVHSTVTLEPDQPAVVTNMGTSNAANFKFEIPKGPKGDTGGDVTIFDSMPIGAMLAFPGDIAPNGWLIMNPDYSRTTYAELFAVIGTKFGSGDGSTTFGTNIKGRVPVALDTSQTEFNVIGKLGGHKLLQAHSHQIGGEGAVTYGGYRAYFWSSGPYSTWATNDAHAHASSTGGGDSQNLQPYFVTNYIIKAFNVAATASTSTVVNNLTQGGVTDSLSAEMGKYIKSILDTRYGRQFAVNSGDVAYTDAVVKFDGATVNYGVDASTKITIDTNGVINLAEIGTYRITLTAWLNPLAEGNWMIINDYTNSVVLLDLIDRKSPANYSSIHGTVLFTTTQINQKITISTIGSCRFNNGSGRNKGTILIVERTN